MLKTFKSLFSLFLLIIIIFFSGCSEDDPITPQEEHFEAIGVYLHDSGIKIASILRGVTTDTLIAPVGGLGGALNVQFYDEDENIIDPPTSGQTLRIEVGDNSMVSIFQHEGEEGGFEFHLRGLKAGVTYIELFIVHGDHDDFRSGHIPVRVED
jgi:hypothetical protein